MQSMDSCHWVLVRGFDYESFREGVPKKATVLLDFVQITSPQFGQLVQLFLNAKNVDLGDIQNDTLSKIQTIDQKGGDTPLTDTIC